jgi:hypothetical protein
LTTTGDLYACESRTNFDTNINRQQSSTTSHTLRVRVPRRVARHVAQLITRLVAPLVIDYTSRRLVVDYSASRRLVLDYFASAARPGASARRAARRAARRRLLHAPRLVTRLVAPRVVDYSASRRLVVDYSVSRRLVVDYFASAARTGASARCEARRAARRRLLHVVQACHAARRAARRRLLRLTQARRRLLRLRRAYGCLGTVRGSSRRSSSATPRRAGLSRGSSRRSS